MHQIRFWMGALLRPRLRWGAHSDPPDTLAGYWGSYQAYRGHEISHPYPNPYPQVFLGYPWIYPYPQTPILRSCGLNFLAKYISA